VAGLCDEEPVVAANLVEYGGRYLQQLQASAPAALAKELDVVIRDRTARVGRTDPLIHLSQEKPIPLLITAQLRPLAI